MDSLVAWLDFSDADRRQMMEVVRMFQVRETRDELGVASIRDAFSNLLFPGTSTIQTRGRYFLFVPWLYQKYEDRKLPSSKVDSYLRYDEVQIIRALTEAGETDGVIGGVAGESLQRFPSNIYWNGLAIWGIRRFRGSQPQYHRWLNSFYENSSRVRRTDDGDPIDDSSRPNWDPNLPAAPDDFPHEVTFQFKLQEAEYLRERLMESVPDSLLTFLVDQCSPVEDVPFVWFHPEAASFPERLRSPLLDARNFSELLHGASLLYNLMLAQEAGMADQEAQYEEDLVAWSERLSSRWATFTSWDQMGFWQLVHENGNIPASTRRFVDRWWDLVLDLGPGAVVWHQDAARELVRLREIRLKRSRSRFRSKRHLEIWGGGSGTGQMDFRWTNASRVINDILHGLGRS